MICLGAVEVVIDERSDVTRSALAVLLFVVHQLVERENVRPYFLDDACSGSCLLVTRRLDLFCGEVCDVVRRKRRVGGVCSAGTCDTSGSQCATRCYETTSGYP